MDKDFSRRRAAPAFSHCAVTLPCSASACSPTFTRFSITNVWNSSSCSTLVLPAPSAPWHPDTGGPGPVAVNSEGITGQKYTIPVATVRRVLAGWRRVTHRQITGNRDALRLPAFDDAPSGKARQAAFPLARRILSIGPSSLLFICLSWQLPRVPVDRARPYRRQIPGSRTHGSPFGVRIVTWCLARVTLTRQFWRVWSSICLLELNRTMRFGL